jgi:hypothetical protein
MDRNELPLDQRHLEVPSGLPQKISMPVVYLAQTVHLSCVAINTINNVSKRSEASFHLTNVTKKYHRVCLKRFSCLWYIRRKLCTYCTYLALRLTLSPNGPKWASTWPTSPRSTIACIQNDFQAYGMFGAKPCTYLALRLTLSPNRLK